MHRASFGQRSTFRRRAGQGLVTILLLMLLLASALPVLAQPPTDDFGDAPTAAQSGFAPSYSTTLASADAQCKLYTSDFVIPSRTNPGDDIEQWDPATGTLLNRWKPVVPPGVRMWGSVWDIDAYNGELYIGHPDAGSITKFDLAGNFLGYFLNGDPPYAAGPGGAAGTLEGATSFDRDASGRIYVCDSYYNSKASVIRFDANGANGVHLINVGSYLSGVFVEQSTGEIYVMYGKGATGGVARYNSAGSLLDKNDLATPFNANNGGNDSWQMTELAFGMTMKDGKLFLVQANYDWPYSESGVLELSYQKVGGGSTATPTWGTQFKWFAANTFGETGMRDPRDLEFSPEDGNLYVAQHKDGDSQVYKFNGTSGAFISRFPSTPNDMQFKGLTFACAAQVDLDWGDLPDSYGTTSAVSGPNHTIVPTLKLGANEDSEADGQPSLAASGDDLNPPAGPDDEDGVALVTPLVAGQEACVSVTAASSAAALLNGWIDFNGDGDFTGDPSDALTFTKVNGAPIAATTNGPVAAGGFSNRLYCFNVPATALGNLGQAYMRFRLSTAGSLPPTGPAADGEVEDYATPLGAIGNYVWVDENSDGYQDAGERGIPNVQINLKDAQGNVIATTYTDSHGGYLFPNLPAGSYFVDVVEATLPAGMTQTPFNLPGADFGNQDQSGTGYAVTIDGAQPLENLTADFGYNFNPTVDVDNPPSGATAALGDRLWIDVDGDGAQDPDEVGVRGATVQIFTAGPDGIFGTGDDIPGATQVTDANGYYLFDGLQPGAYVVKVTSSAGASHDVLGSSYTQTGDPDHFGTTGTNNDNQTTAPVVLGPGDVFLNADFGYQPNAGVTLGTIGDTVWFDANASGTPTLDAGEYGIPGVTVALIRDTNGNGVWDAGEPIIATDTTDASGQYLFTGLSLSDNGDGNPADADYIVWVNDTDSVLTGLKQTYDQDAPLDNRSATALSAGTPSDLDQDFSYTAAGQTPTTGLIGDTVWFDLNNSGGATQQAGEPGIEGVVMELLDSVGNVIATTTTNENGNYYFGGLPVSAGGIQYQVRVAASNFAAGGVLQGIAETYAAGGTVGGNQGALVSLSTANPINLAQDFSYTATQTPGRIGNLVWLDSNADGVFTSVDGPDGLAGTDDDEPAIGGVTIDLYRDLNCNGRVDAGDPRISTQATANAINAGSYGTDGVYIFNRLATAGACAGNTAGYVVNVTDTSGVLFGYWHSLGTAGQNNNSQVDPYAAQISAAQVDNLTADFGYYIKPAALGNFVWEDLNEDGIQDAGEPGIDGVEVTLVITWPNGDETSLTTLTGDDPSTPAVEQGWYSFGNLLLDEDYRVGSATSTPGVNQPVHELSVAAPAGMEVTIVTVLGSTPFNDSNDPDGTVGVPQQGLTNVSFSQNGTTPASYDFGFITDDTLDPAPQDLGDLPPGYPTLLANDGARHVASNRLYLGTCVDTETDGQPSASANGDDSNLAGPTTARFGSCSPTNDEDGVSKAAAINSGSWAVGAVSANQGGGLRIVIGAGVGVPQVFMDFTDDANYTLSPVTLYYDHDNNAGTAVVPYTGTPLPAGAYTFYFDIPAGVTNSTPIPTRVRLSGTGGLGPTGSAPRGEVEDYIFEIGAPLAVNLAAFEATVQANHVLVAWETVSELNNVGFNLYRATAQDGERTLLGFVAAQAPGSTAGASYSYQDAEVTQGQGYWYWLEDIDASGAASLHGPVSVSYLAPTAVTLDGLSAEASTIKGALLAWVVLAALLLAAAATFRVIRRRVTS